MLTLRLLFLLSGLCLLVVTTALADAFPVMLAIGYWGRLLLDTACRACVLENHNEEEDKAIVMANYTLDRLSMGCLYFSVLKSSGRTLSERVLLGVSCVLHLLSFEVRHEQVASNCSTYMRMHLCVFCLLIREFLSSLSIAHSHTCMYV